MSESADQRVILYGAGKRCRKLMELFPQCARYVDFVADRNAGEVDEGVFSFPVLSPDALRVRRREGQKVVVTPRDDAEIRHRLQMRYCVPEADLITREAWICELIRDRRILIRPSAVRLDICTRCQLDCVDCHMRADPGERIGSGYLPAPVFRAFLDRHPFIRRVEISNNGEPFLHPQISEILRSARERQVTLTITNGTNLNYLPDEILPELVSGTVSEMRVSVDGASGASYAKYRRGGSLTRVLENLRRLVQAREQAASSSPKLVWQFVLMEHNLEEMQAAEHLARQLGMTIEFKESWNPETARRVRERLHGAEAVPYGSEVGEDGAQQSHITDYVPVYCRDMLLAPQINWDGRLLGCCTVYRTDWEMNVFEEGLLCCVNSDRYRDAVIRLMQGERPASGTPCADCVTARQYGSAMRITL